MVKKKQWHSLPKQTAVSSPQMVFLTQHVFDVVTPETFDNLLSFKSFQDLKGKKNFVLAIYVEKNKNLYFIQFCSDRYSISSVG